MVVMENRKSVTVIPLSVDNFFQTDCDIWSQRKYTSKYMFYSSCIWRSVQETFTFLIFFATPYCYDNTDNAALPGSSSTFLLLGFVMVHAYVRLQLLLLVQKWFKHFMWPLSWGFHLVLV